MEALELSTQSPAFQLSLRVRHPSIDPAALSREFAIEAEHSFQAGQPRRSRSGLTPGSVHAETYWLATLNPASWLDLTFPGRPSLEAAKKLMGAAVTQSLGWALSLSATRFRNRHAALLQQISSEGGRVTLLVALSAGTVSGFSLTPEVGRTFAELGITLEFEFTGD
jgi:hypothetical protein